MVEILDEHSSRRPRIEMTVQAMDTARTLRSLGIDCAAMTTFDARPTK
jgi:hypothetical protein